MNNTQILKQALDEVKLNIRRKISNQLSGIKDIDDYISALTHIVISNPATNWSICSLNSSNIEEALERQVVQEILKDAISRKPKNRIR